MRPSTLKWELSSGFLYLALLLAAVILPLRLDEVLQLAAANSQAGVSLLRWIASTPGAAPLGYFTEWPLALLPGHNRLAVRFISILCALLASGFMWHIARKMGLKHPLAASAVFGLLPAQYLVATSAIPAAEALLFLVAATSLLLDLTRKPQLSIAVAYGALLTLTIYTHPLAISAAIGYLLFFIRFVTRPPQRRAFWFLLPATAVPLLLYLPYYIWATPQAAPHWLFAPVPTGGLWQQTGNALAGYSFWGWGVLAILFIGASIAIWSSFRPPFSERWTTLILHRNAAFFCLTGGLLSAIVTALASSQFTSSPVRVTDTVPALPALVLLSIAGFEYSKRTPFLALAALAMALCLAGDIDYLRMGRAVNLQAVADAAAREIQGDACVVFVSEGVSRPIFFTLRPDLEKRECSEFFHSRIVLALHPYVRPDQQRDAETFFRGLNFHDQKRIHVGGGQVIVLSESRT